MVKRHKMNHMRRFKAGLAGCKGFRPALYVAGDYFAGYRKATLIALRTRSLPILWLRFNSDMVASTPERMLYCFFHSGAC
jgi:hypothetical protein